MSRYVCDFEELKNIAINLKKHSDNMESALRMYESKIQSELNTWSGVAQKEFMASSQTQITSTKKYITNIEELSDFITKAVNAIETAEQDISSIKI